MTRQSDAGEIVHAVMLCYPGERNVSYGDMTTAKWLNEDVIRVVVHERKDWLDSWFNAVLVPTKICRHMNWKACCNACMKKLGGQLEAFDVPNTQPRKRKDSTKL